MLGSKKKGRGKRSSPLPRASPPLPISLEHCHGATPDCGGVWEVETFWLAVDLLELEFQH